MVKALEKFIAFIIINRVATKFLRPRTTSLKFPPINQGILIVSYNTIRLDHKIERACKLFFVYTTKNSQALGFDCTWTIE